MKNLLTYFSKKLLSTRFTLFALLLSVGVGQMWATKTYKLTAVSSVSADNMYVFVEDSHAFTTTGSKKLNSTSSYSTTGLTGSENYVYLLESSENGFKLKNCSTSTYLSNSKADMSLNASGSEWYFTFSGSVAKIQDYATDRFIGETGTDEYTYKAYVTDNWGTYGRDVYVYRLEEEMSTKTVYLDATYFSESDKFGVYSWKNGAVPDDNKMSDAYMSSVSECRSNIYKADIPSNHDRVIFLHCSSGATPAWGTKDKQTVNLTPEDNNFFTITSGSGDSYDGTWSTYAENVIVLFTKNTTANGVDDPDPQCVVKTTGHATEPTISDMSHGRLGYELDGWYENAAGTGSAWNFATGTFSDDKELFAKWVEGSTTTVALLPTWSGDGNTWDKDNSIIFAHFYIDGTTQAQNIQMTKNVCDGVFTVEAPYGATHVSFARCTSGTVAGDLTGNWATNDHVQNCVYGCEMGGSYYYAVLNWGDYGQKEGGKERKSTAYTPTTFTISFDGDDPTSGTMDDITGIACNANQVLPSNTFTKTGKLLSCWHANVDVKVGGSTITAGGDIADGATIQNIQSNITLTAQWVTEVLSTPTFTPSSGTMRKPTDAITISCANDGTTIYYTTDGTNPTTSSPVYSGPMLFEGGVTIKAMATKAGCANSSVATATYTYGREFVLATSSTTFSDLDEIVIMDSTSTYALSTTQNTSNRPHTTSGFSWNSSNLVVPEGSATQIILLEKNDSYWFFNVGDNKYLYSGTSNKFKTVDYDTQEASLKNNDVWSISINAVGSNAYEKNNATILTHGDNTSTPYLGYNAGSSLFNCYNDNSAASKRRTKIYHYHPTTPFVRCFPNTLLTFEYAVGFGPSLAQAVTVKGDNLNGSLTVNCPSGYELSSDGSTFAASNLTLTKDGNNKVNTTIYVRMAAGNSTGTYDRILSITGGGITATNMPLEGDVTANDGTGDMYSALTDASVIFPYDEMVLMNDTGTWIMNNTNISDGSKTNQRASSSGFTYKGTTVYVTDSYSAVQKITTEESGTDNRWLFKAGNRYLYTGLTDKNQLTTGTNRETAISKGSWKIETNCTGVATIHAPEATNVRDTINFNYNNGSPLFSCYNRSCKGGAVSLYYRILPNIWPSSEMTEFSTTTGAGPSDPQSFTFKAKNITSGDVTITAPDNFEICLTADGTYTSSLTVSPDGAHYIDETTVYVRMKDVEVASPSGNITLAATGATTRNVPVSGTVTPLTVTYHSASEDNHVVDVWYDGSVDAYTPANCANGKVFVGWHTAEVTSLQQSDPTTNTTGALDNVTSSTDLYAVFASPNGKATSTILDEDWHIHAWDGTNNIVKGAFSAWTTNFTPSSYSFTASSTTYNAIVYSLTSATTLTSRTKYTDLSEVQITASSRNSAAVDVTVKTSSDGSSWSSGITKSLGSASSSTPATLTFTLPEKGDYYVQIAIGACDSKSIGITHIHLFQGQDFYLTDYSTTCDLAASAAISWVNNGGSIASGTEPSAPANVGDAITLPTLSKADYRFDGWKATINDVAKTDLFRGGDPFIVNHAVTLTAQWTRLFTITTPAAGVTTYKDITTTSVDNTFSTVAAETWTRPTINSIAGTDAAKFGGVAITAAAKESTDSVYTFVYTYTHNDYGSGSGAATHTATVTFTDPSSGTVSSPVTLRGRTLPEEFVIAVKNGNTWVALPNNLASGSSQPSIVPQPITVNNTTTPTAAVYAPTTTVYKAMNRGNVTHNTAIRFTTTESNYLQVSSVSDTYNMWLSTSNSANVQDWQLKSTDFNAYELTIPSTSLTKKMGIYQSTYIGYHGSPNNADIYFLPITNKYTEVAATASEWGEHEAILQIATPSDLTSAASATIHIDNATPTAATITAVNAALGTANRVKVDGGALTIGAVANENKQLYVHWKNGEGTEIGISQVTIPCIIAADATMSSIADTKVAWAAKSEVHILPGKTLDANAGSFTGDGALNISNLFVYPGATLKVSTGTFKATTLRLRNGWTRAGTKKYDVARVYIADDAALTHTTASMDYDIYELTDGRHYYPLAVPFETAVNTIDYADTYLAGFSNYGTTGQYVIKEYDGARRAEKGPDQANNWKVVPLQDEEENDVYLKPGKGYIISAVAVKGEAIIRIPLVYNDAWTADGEKGTANYDEADHTKNVVAVLDYTGTATSGGKKVNEGWNLLGVLFMSCYATGEDMGTSVVMQGKFDFSTGNWTDDKIRYVNVPTHDFSEYIQTDMEEDDPVTELLPGWCFFVQVKSDGNLTFLTADQVEDSDLPIYAPRRERAEMPVETTGIILSGGDASDRTTIIVSDKYHSADYEVGADLEKMFGNGYTLATYSLSGSTRLAYNAMSTSDATAVIPIGYRAPADGTYTFSLNPRYAEANFERVDLIDYQTGSLTNLMTSSYTFTSGRTQNDTRFTINIVPRQETPTDVENGVNGANGANGVEKVIINDHMYIIRGGQMFDATGKKVREINK